MTETKKHRDLKPFIADPDGEYLTTNQGVRIQHTDDSLKAGARGPTLLEDFHLREKITHFDHERIPERVVHARGSAAHGVFQLYEPLGEFTRAHFLQDPGQTTPVFVRFSTVAGSRGSADTVRDVRGFAVKFYTDEGNFDLVGNNIPVFFIQDGIKFPDLIHSVKPEPRNEIPQAASAHDSFWDFVSLVPESTHMLLWHLSDRTLPRSFSMMEGFGVHTYRLIDAKGQATFVKFHWKPLLGVHSLAWDEAQKICGKDPDFHRRDLWESIARGNFPEWELGVQLIPEQDESSFDFDLLDATKLVPEELVPVRRIGKMTLNRNPDNFFAETEQVAFCVANVVPGIDFSDDPLLQTRIFSYLDTQLTRLGGPNHHEIPINRPVAKVRNNQQDGFHRATINPAQAHYYPNSLSGGCPMLAPEAKGGYVHYPEQVTGRKIRARSQSFQDHYSQAALFWRSLSAAEQRHLVQAAHFELGKVERKDIRRRMVENFARVDAELAQRVAAGLGMNAPSTPPAAAPAGKRSVQVSPALSMASTPSAGITGRKIALLIAEGVDLGALLQVRSALDAAGAVVEVVAPQLGALRDAAGGEVMVDKSLLTTASVLYDAVVVAGGAAALASDGDAVTFVNDAARHCKAIGALAEGAALLTAAGVKPGDGVVVAAEGAAADAFAAAFLKAVAQLRFWGREVRV